MIRNVSRRALFASAGALVLSAQVPLRAQPASPLPLATKINSYFTVNPDGTCHIMNPFVEGGQGIDTAVVQILAEELDASPDCFTISCAPPGADFAVMNIFGQQMRFTGGSFSVRSSYAHFCKLGATARAMLVQAAANQLGVPAAELTTANGQVLHAVSGRALEYAALAATARNLPVPPDAEPKSPANFHMIGSALPRLDVRAKSTGQTRYAIDIAMPNMLRAAVIHAPRAGDEPAGIGNEAAVRDMPGVFGIHRLPGAMAVTADSFWRARKAAEALEIAWAKTERSVPAGFTNDTMLSTLKQAMVQPGRVGEQEGEIAVGMAQATRTIEAEYDAPYLAHGQLEPPSALAAFQPDGSLEVWTPNQAPEGFQALAAAVSGLPPERIMIHSQPLGGFFGRHFMYGPATIMPQAILLARETGRPVKVIWTREEEFGRDAYRPLAHARFKAGLDSQGNLIALEVKGAGEGPTTRHQPPEWLVNGIDDSIMEGLMGKPYRVPHARIAFIPQPHPPGVNVGYWRSVGHSMNEFFFESFLDEVAHEAGRDPFMFRQALLQHSPRHLRLLNALAELAGTPWRALPYQHADGSRRARGVSMSSPFGSHTATLAEVSIAEGAVRVHELWIAIDPGSIVNPGIIAQQVEGAAALGLSSALFEEMTFEDGMPAKRNFDTYTVLRRDSMPKVNVRIVESGEPMGGIGEPGLPGVVPALANAVFNLTGQRIRSLPLAKTRLGQA